MIYPGVNDGADGGRGARAPETTRAGRVLGRLAALGRRGVGRPPGVLGKVREMAPGSDEGASAGRRQVRGLSPGGSGRPRCGVPANASTRDNTGRPGAGCSGGSGPDAPTPSGGGGCAGERVSSGCGGLMGWFMSARGPTCSGPLGRLRGEWPVYPGVNGRGGKRRVSGVDRWDV